ncbi:hypothetical protein MBLNU457_7726t1 [Dothideomycetes sp. NU457]
MAVHVLDNYYLAITLLITIGYQLFFFSIAFTFKFDKLTDFAGGTNFALSFSGTHEARNIVTSLFLIIWALRLSGFLLFRILKTGSDTRFDGKRDHFFKFLGFWVAQMLWVWTVSLPVTILNSPNVLRYRQPSFGSGSDIAGVVFWTIGFFMEAISDVQKYRFKMFHKEPTAVCDKGFFGWSRHPNYMGEILVQFSIYMLAVTPATFAYFPGSTRAALYASVVGPVFLTTLLMFVSGLTLQERPAAKKKYEKGEGWPEYRDYLHKTSMLIPFPPQIYRRLPVFLKRTVFLEFPIYVFDPAKHADQDKVRAREQEEGRGRQDSDAPINGGQQRESED